MANRRAEIRPTVELVYAFDRLFDDKLQNAYAIVVPQERHKTPDRRQAIEVNDEACSPICTRLRRAAKR